MRIAFFGTPLAAVPSFEEVTRRHEVVLVVTQPERGRGAGRSRPVAAAAAARGVPVRAPLKAKEVAEDVAALEPEAAAVVAYGQILPPSVLALFPLGMVNLHFSLLPRWRGAAPVERALLAGDQVTGVSTMLLDEGMDTGPVLRRVEVPVLDDERAGELTERLARIGAPVLADSLTSLAEGSATPEPQDESLATYAPKLDPEEGRLDWSRPAQEVVRRVRACHPRPGAFTFWEGRRLKVLDAVVGDVHGGRPAGAILPEPLRAAAADRWVVLREVQLEGRQPLAGDSFARGARLHPDAVFSA